MTVTGLANLAVKVSDLDAALDWARKFARALTTPVEVRPFMEYRS